MIIRNNKGFTLLEMLVVSAIFVMAMTAMVTIFVQTNRVQKRLANSEKLQADTRYVVELMAREIRNNRIDYSFYINDPDGVDNGFNLSKQPVDYLALRDIDNNQIIFHFVNVISPPSNKIEIKRTSINKDWHNITPDDISVTAMSLFLSPNSDPFDITDLTPPDEQPLVTIALTTQSLTPDLDESKWIRYQTAISSRFYAR